MIRTNRLLDVTLIFIFAIGLDAKAEGPSINSSCSAAKTAAETGCSLFTYPTANPFVPAGKGLNLSVPTMKIDLSVAHRECLAHIEKCKQGCFQPGLIGYCTAPESHVQQKLRSIEYELSKRPRANPDTSVAGTASQGVPSLPPNAVNKTNVPGRPAEIPVVATMPLGRGVNFLVIGVKNDEPGNGDKGRLILGAMLNVRVPLGPAAPPLSK